MIRTETIDRNAIENLRSRLQGELILPGDKAYTESSKAWNLNASQRPAIIIKAAHAEDIIVAVQFARDANIGIGVMATGHGVGKPCDGGLLVNTSGLRGVTIDPVLRTATVAAGTLWKEVIAAASEHGLAGLAGSAPHVGVVGYTLGGGFGYLGRKYGLNVSGVITVEVVTAEGKHVRVSADENSELFWAMKGSAGNFGIVTSLTFQLYPGTKVYGGAVFYPVEQAREALKLFAHWTHHLPDEVTAAFAFMNVPPLPSMPEMLRGKSVVIIRGCYCGEDMEQGEKLFRSVRKGLGQPIADTFGVMPVTMMDTITKDPVDPMGLMQYGGMLIDLPDKAIETFVKLAGAGSASPLTILEFRQLGGALKNNQHDIQLMGSSNARFSMNALGATFTPALAEKVNVHLIHFAEMTRPYVTGESFVNHMEVDPSEERVRSAYTAKDWQRLVQLKTKYDPQNVFRFNRNIPPMRKLL